MMIAPVMEGIVSRSLISQIADSLLDIKGMEASFVIGAIDHETIAVSARSKGVVNVQVIMEKMSGGGHFGAAALQRKNTTVEAVYEELIQKIEEYTKESKEESEDESNLIK